MSRSTLRTSIVALATGVLVATVAIVGSSPASSAPQATPRDALDGDWMQVAGGFSANPDDTLSQVFQLISREEFPDLRGTPGPLYAAGTFITSGGTTINRVARLHQAAWATLPGDDTGIDPGVAQSVRNSLPVPGVYGLLLGGDDSLYAGGVFTRSDDTLNNVGQWNGSDWQPMGFGLKSGSADDSTVQDMVMGNDFIGGDDTNYADDTVYAVGAFDGPCSDVNCTGTLRTAAGLAEYSQADDTWYPVGSGSMTGSAFAGAYIDDTLYVGGTFTRISGKSLSSVAQWSNVDDTWHALGGGMPGGRVYAMAVHPITRDLYVGGYLVQPNGYSASFSPGIVKWDYSDDTWYAVGTGLVNPDVDDIAFSRDGSTMWLGMSQGSIGGSSAGNVVQLSTTQLTDPDATTISAPWNTLTSGGATGIGFTANAQPGNVNQSGVRAVYGLLSESVIAGGNFHTAGVASVGRIARWSPPPPPPPAPPILYPPSAPTGVSAQGDVGSVNVSWSMPASQGSFPITNYQVVASPAGATCLTAALTCTFGGLSVGTAYTFQVQALNGAGWGELSAPSNAASPLAPPPPSSTSINEAKRVKLGRGTAVGIKASTVSIAAGSAIVPWTRIGRGDWTPNTTSSLVVGPDGDFTWKRKFSAKANRSTISVKFAVGAVESASVDLRPVR